MDTVFLTLTILHLFVSRQTKRALYMSLYAFSNT